MRELPIVDQVERLEHLEALDETVETAERVIGQVPDDVRDLLHGVPIGHPVHPIAVLIPAGSWISAAVLDLLPGESRAAQALVGLGVLAAVPTATTGWADWAELDRGQKRVGIVHAAANVTAVTLYSLSWLQRRRGRQLSGKLLGFAGLAVISAGGYLGGHMAYRQVANNDPRYRQAGRLGDGGVAGLLDGVGDDSADRAER